MVCCETAASNVIAARERVGRKILSVRAISMDRIVRPASFYDRLRGKSAADE
jgi:hypothetical protein